MTEEKKMTEQEQQQWVRNQYQVATKYLAEKGLVTNSVNVDESRYLIPFVSIWKLKLLDGSYVWAICGDLPTDHCEVSAAATARDAVRYFSFKWQMQAENLLKSDQKEQYDFAQLLISRAEGLYEFQENEAMWVNQ